MLIVMQGLPRSGKSTEAAKLAQQFGAVIVSTDDLFIVNGVYTFDASLLQKHHRTTQDKAAKLLAAGKSVVVDNTNLQRWEARPYVEAALKHGHEVRFVRCSGEWENTHGVPADKIERMRGRMEDLTVENVMDA